MPNWSEFRRCLKEGDARVELLKRIRQVEIWSDLSFEQARAQLNRETIRADIGQIRSIYSALTIARQKLFRDAAFPSPGPQFNRRWQTLLSTSRQGAAFQVLRQSVSALSLRLTSTMKCGLRKPVEESHARVELSRRARQAEAWLDLAFEEARDRFKKETACDLRQIRPIHNALVIARHQLSRRASFLPQGPKPHRYSQKLLATAQQGAASTSDQRLARRLVTSMLLSQNLAKTHPELLQSVASDNAEEVLSIRQSILALSTRLAPLVKRSALGIDLPATVNELREVLRECQQLAENASDGNPARLEALYWAAECAYWLGINGASGTWLQQAAIWYEHAGAPERAANCREQIRRREVGLSADIDRLARESLEALLSKQPAGEPLGRALAMAGLTDVAVSIGDSFEAERITEATAAELARLGFADPEVRGLDAAVDLWIDHVPSGESRTPFYKTLNLIHKLYSSVLGGRAVAYARSCPVRATRTQELLTGLSESLEAMRAEESAINSEIARELLEYFPEARRPRSESEDSADLERKAGERDRLRSKLDQAWQGLREGCNRRAQTDSVEDLLTKAVELQGQAAALHTPLYDAKARLAQTYVLLSRGRAQEALPLAEEARSLLLAGKQPTVDAFGSSFERDVYLEALSHKTDAFLMLRDFQAASNACGEAIEMVESERYRVSSPYQTSSFMANRADFYWKGVFAAFKLEQWDNLLKRMELVKARSALRSRLVPEMPELDASDLMHEFRETSAALHRLNQASPEAQELAMRRRHLWDLISIVKARHGTAERPPEPTLKNLQSALCSDEVAVGYFLLTPRVLLILVIDREQFHCEKVDLKDAYGVLTEFVSEVQKLKSFVGDGLDDLVAELGEYLLPPPVRNALTGKKRLIISAHRSLHLFPFHATRWEQEFLIQRFAVRYVPNFSSLLLSWQTRSGNRGLALGIKDFAVPEVKPIPHAEDEIEGIRQVYEQKGFTVDTLIGPAATRGQIEEWRATQRLSDFRWLHLATHGTSVFDHDTQDEPMESKLCLYDGLLDGIEIAELRLSAELVVLSACNSGQRALAGRGLPELPGDDIFGLQSAFFQAGARCILGALWPVDSAIAGRLMTAFHRHHVKQDCSSDMALQAAMCEYLRDSRYPYTCIYFWAPFFLISLGSYAKINSAL